MSRRRLIGAALAAGVLAVTATVATGAVGHHRRVADRFTLHGHVSGLYPGVRRRLGIVVHNPGRSSLTVRSITTHVRDASAACKARNLHVSAFRGRLRVRAHGSRRVAVRLWMRPDSPAACQGRVFSLAFHGRARVGRSHTGRS